MRQEPGVQKKKVKERDLETYHEKKNQDQFPNNSNQYDEGGRQSVICGKRCVTRALGGDEKDEGKNGNEEEGSAKEVWPTVPSVCVNYLVEPTFSSVVGSAIVIG